MRHRKKTVKLGRTSAHRNALLAGLVCQLVRHRRITTTVAKAKAARSLADRAVTLAKKGTLAARRRALALLRKPDAVKALFAEIAPALADRNSGYTRVVRLGKKRSDGGELAILEWVNYVPPPPKKKKKETEGQSK